MQVKGLQRGESGEFAVKHIDLKGQVDSYCEKMQFCRTALLYNRCNQAK